MQRGRVVLDDPPSDDPPVANIQNIVIISMVDIISKSYTGTTYLCSLDFITHYPDECPSFLTF